MKWLVIVGALALAGCGGVQRNLERVAAEGADVADNVLGNAEFVVCRAATVGSVARRYFSDADKAAAWAELCFGDGFRVPAPPD